jgi:hypothetical protein
MWCWARYRVLFYMRFLFSMNCDRSGDMLDLQDTLLCVDGSKRLVFVWWRFQKRTMAQLLNSFRAHGAEHCRTARWESEDSRFLAVHHATRRQLQLEPDWFRDHNSYWNIWNAQTDTRWYKHIEAQWDFRFSVTSNLVSTEVSETIGFCSRWKTIKPDA